MKLGIALVVVGLCILLAKAKPSARRMELVEGDMLLSEEQVQVYNQVENGRVRRAVMKGNAHFWPKGEVPYKLAADLSQTAKDRVKDAIKHWQEKTCLKFKTAGASDKYNILFKHDAGGACNSYVGFWKRKDQEINVGSKAKACKLGSVIHEIGHAIGFYHEHVRPDRDEFVTYNEDNVHPSISEEKKKVNWGKKGKDEIDSRGFDYDLGSIMHYSREQGANPGTSVLVPKKPNVKIGQRDGLSDGDIAQAKNMYKCNAQGDSELEYDPAEEEKSGKPTQKPEINE